LYTISEVVQYFIQTMYRQFVIIGAEPFAEILKIFAFGDDRCSQHVVSERHSCGNGFVKRIKHYSSLADQRKMIKLFLWSVAVRWSEIISSVYYYAQGSTIEYSK